MEQPAQLPDAPPPLQVPELAPYQPQTVNERKRRAKWLQNSVETDRTGAMIFSVLGNMLVKVAIMTEPPGPVRRERRKRLTQLWRNYSNRAMNITRGRT
jgi:hypothetical protein